MAEAPTPEMVISWFREYQKNCIVKDGTVPEWFHGIISRKQSEELLIGKPPGYFLIRVSESRIGYTLSYRAKERCRHFMIDMLPDNQYKVLGERIRHSSLHDLVAFHRRVPIVPYAQLLTVACGQVSTDRTDYAELIFPKRNVSPPCANVWPNDSSFSDDTGPAIPAYSEVSRPSHQAQNLYTSVMPSASLSCPRLYPSLESELGTTNSVEPPPLLPRTGPKFSSTAPQDAAQRAPSVGGDPNGSQTEFTKRRRPMPRTPSEDGAVMRNHYGAGSEMKDGGFSFSCSTDEMPAEYLQPPPFAPGY